MKILFAVLTCNRFHYLRNCVNSILEFVDLEDCEIMILDVCTIEPGIDDYYNELGDKVIIKKFDDRVPNELYRSMNYAIQYCQKNKIHIVNFIQDDYQYLYNMPNMIRNVCDLFKHRKDIGQIQTNMIWKRKSVGKYKTVCISDTNYAILHDKMVVDTGFTRVKLYKKIGLYPQGVISYDQKSHKTFGFGKNRYKKHTNGELWFGKHCRKRKIKRAISMHPNMTMMFDCAYVRKWNRFGKYFPAPEKYYIKPFCSKQIARVAKHNKKKKFSFIEKMSEPHGWTPSTFGKHNLDKIVNKIK